MTVRVGRDGFTGSPITVWCPTCSDWVVEKGDYCLWCEQRVTLTDAEVRAQARAVRDELHRQGVRA